MGSVVLTRFCLGLCIKTRSVLGMFLLIRENLFCWPQFGPTAIAGFFFSSSHFRPISFLSLASLYSFFFHSHFLSWEDFFFWTTIIQLESPQTENREREESVQELF